MAVRDKARKAMWKECDMVAVETQVVTPKVVLDLDLWNTSSQCKKTNVCFCEVRNTSRTPLRDIARKEKAAAKDG